MPDTLMRSFLDSIWPDGSIWRPRPTHDLDHLLDGISDAWQAVKDDMESLAFLRDPRRTPFLDDLERDFGIAPNMEIPDAQRRAILADKKYRRGVHSTIDTMQDTLDAAGLGDDGFGLHVFANDPAVDPQFFTTNVPQTYCGGPNAFCGYVQNALPTASWTGIAHNGSVWCAVSSDGYAATSPDLIVWTPQSIQVKAWSALVWTGTVFAAVSTDGACSTSPTGVTWTAQTMTAGSWNALVWTGTQLVAVGAGPTNYCATSPTGVTWTAQAGLSVHTWRAIAWNGSILCAVGETGLATSPTGVTWTDRSPTGGDINKLCAVAWNGSAWAAVGDISEWHNSGPPYYTPYTIRRGAIVSPDGITWTIYDGPGVSWNFRSMVWVASLNLFVLVGVGDKQCQTSPDGISWTSRMIPSGSWNAVAMGTTTLAAVGSGAIQEAISLNAITWTVAGTGSGGNAFCGTLGGGFYLVNGDVFTNAPAYWGCGAPEMCCGYIPTGGSGSTAVCGYFTSYNWTYVQQASPADPASWPCIFFIAAAVVRDSGGYIVGITNGVLPNYMRHTLVDLVMRLKPLNMWAVLVCNYN